MAQIKYILLFLFPFTLFGQETIKIKRNDTVTYYHSQVFEQGRVDETKLYDTSSFCATFDRSNTAQIYDNDLLSQQTITGADTAFWISYWLYLQDAQNGIICKNYEYVNYFSSTYDIFYFNIHSGGAAGVYIGKKSAVLTSLLNTWINVILTYTGSGQASGLKIYINNVDQTGGDNNAGTYAKMANGTGSTYIGYTDGSHYLNGRLYDIRMGKGTLSVGDRAVIYARSFLGRETFALPCSEGYGLILHNTANSNISLSATLTDPSTKTWENSQYTWYYNRDYGVTKVNDYRFPNYIDKTKSFQNIKTVLIFGQSNAGFSARADSLHDNDTLYLQPQERAHRYNTQFNYFSNTKFKGGTEFGLLPVLGYKYDSINTDVALINASNGSTMLYDSTGVTDFNIHSGELFNTYQGFINAGLTKLFTLGKLPTVQSFIWVQGETDAYKPKSALAYQTNLSELIDSLRSYYTSFNFQVPRLSTNTTFTYKNTVRTAQTNVTTLKSDVTLINTDTFPLAADATHYQASGFLKMGKEIFTNIRNKPEDSAWWLQKMFPSGYSITYYFPKE